MDTVFSCNQCTLRLLSNDGFKLLEDAALLTVHFIPGQTPVITVGSHTVEWLPFQRLDHRHFRFSTGQLAVQKLITLPDGLDESEYVRFETILGAIRDNKPHIVHFYKPLPMQPVPHASMVHV